MRKTQTSSEQYPSIEPNASDKTKPSVRQISFLAISDLTPAPHNARRHTRSQIRDLAKSIDAFGFNVPILIDRYRQIVAGHARYEAAKLRDLTQVPVIFLDHLTETEAEAFALADNQFSARSAWDDEKLGRQLKKLNELVLDFDIEAIGFELPEIDLRIQSLDTSDAADNADEFEPSTGPAVSMAGDLWQLGPHRLYCGNALDANAYATLIEAEKAAAVFTDPPYNVKIDGHVSGLGRTTHREFAMASGEMTDEEYAQFLTETMKRICAFTTLGALIYVCMDWRHIGETLGAGQAAECEFVNLCVWAKTNGGMGSLYRSRHELVFVFKNGKHAHLNNVQLGRFGRNRTNVWNYPGFNGFARKGSKVAAVNHPTVKPIALVSDAILDSTKRNDIVLDPYIGSGTTILAAERTGRRCFGIEIDPIYVDTTVDRWQRLTGHEAQNAQGQTFAQIKLERGIGQ
jgi:DNA modification methylase